MTVSAILADKGNAVITGSKDQTVGEIVALLAKNKIGATVIVTPEGKVCGIISERDIVRDIAKHGPDVLQQPVSSCMTNKVISCSGKDTINAAMEIMTRNRFRHLPVMEEGTLIGLISIGDVVKRKIEQAEREAEEIRNYIATS